MIPLVRLLALLLLGLSAAAAQPVTELLWPEGAPGALGNDDQDKPSLTRYLADPAKANGTAVVVCPGGGYRNLAMDHEGKQVAEWLNTLGISAFVLKYRLGPKYHHPIELHDAQRAIRTVRARAQEFHVAANRIGMWGFSAGGHLASTAGTHFDSGDTASASSIDRVGSRPDFLVLAYPVISFIDSVHVGSRTNLIGKDYDPKLAEYLSNDRQVTKDTPPTFLFHTDGDTGVPAENSVLFYLALRRAGVPAEMHIYEKGKHGVGLAQSDPILATWPARLADWFKTRGLLGPAT
jgi:acetyl esterase/lipase